MKSTINISGILIFFLHLISGNGEILEINVQNQGGEVVQETITSNIHDDIITLEFQRSDGTLITQLIDFKSEVQVIKAVVLGEEERGENQFQVMCFVTKFQKGDFISSDAMAKLRQKNPTTIRTPEEDRGRENYTMSAWLINLDRSSPISRHLSICNEAKDSATYVRDVDLKAWSEIPGSSMSILEASVTHFPKYQNHKTTVPRCNEVSGIWAPCICSFSACIGWYPCGLKFCKGKSEGNSINNNQLNSSYRCGIKTCRKCYNFSYYIQKKNLCIWDE